MKQILFDCQVCFYFFELNLFWVMFKAHHIAPPSFCLFSKICHQRLPSTPTVKIYLQREQCVCAFPKKDVNDGTSLPLQHVMCPAGLFIFASRKIGYAFCSAVHWSKIALPINSCFMWLINTDTERKVIVTNSSPTSEVPVILSCPVLYGTSPLCDTVNGEALTLSISKRKQAWHIRAYWLMVLTLPPRRFYSWGGGVWSDSSTSSKWRCYLSSEQCGRKGAEYWQRMCWNRVAAFHAGVASVSRWNQPAGFASSTHTAVSWVKVLRLLDPSITPHSCLSGPMGGMFNSEQ